MSMISISGTPYAYDAARLSEAMALSSRIQALHLGGSLTAAILGRARQRLHIASVYHSNAIEGSLLTLDETRRVVEEGEIIAGKPPIHTTEARNLSRALEFAEAMSSDTQRPILENDVRQLNGYVLEGVTREAGKYRRVQVFLSGSDFVPPGPEHVPSAMMDFGQWLKGTTTAPRQDIAERNGLVAAAVAHTWFVTVHPFIDGNGRVARLLLNLVLSLYGFPVAVIRLEDRQRYYQALAIAHTGDLTPVIALVAERVERSIQEFVSDTTRARPTDL